MSLSFPDTTGLGVFDAAMEYAANGLPVAPFDPSKGKGKSCWNLVGYREVTTSTDVLCEWREQFGPFKALATSPGQFGCVVIDVDRPKLTPQPLRKHLAAAVYINTRPDESPNRGHYWFRLPPGLRLGNPTLPFGEVRCVGGGIVLPPCGDRRVVRAGAPPAVPAELVNYLTAHVVKAGAGVVGGGTTTTVGKFCARYTGNARPQKIAAVVKLHQVLLDRGRSPHDAMREALKVGLSEARIGYVPARAVIRTLRQYWDRDRNEFSRLVHWAIDVAEASNTEQLRFKSDRCPGTDSREYA